MSKIFEAVLEMSVTAGYVILAVMLVRILIRRLPKKYSYALWSVVGFRLICPVSFKAVYSLFSVTERVAPATDRIIRADELYRSTMSQSEVSTAIQNIPLSAADSRIMDILPIIWLIGVGVLVVYAAVSYVRLYLRMRTAVLMEGNVYESDKVRSPFVLGARIYIPFGLDDRTLKYVLSHERYHIRRLDHIVKPLSFLLLAIHWFDPLCWIAFYLMSRDMEMSCDEHVLSSEDDVRKAYSTSLLSFAANRRFLPMGPLSFGETDIRSRIKHVLNWRKPSMWVSVSAVAICIAVAVVCAADPVEKADEQPAPTDYSTVKTVQNVVPDEVDDEPISAAQALEQLRDSIRLTDSSVFFTIPSYHDGSESWNIHISGRGDSDGFTYSVHFFDDEQWVIGKEYEIELEGIVELNMDAWLGDENITVDMLYGMVTDELIGGEAIKYDAVTGQKYFDAWYEHVKSMSERNDEEFMEKHYPKGLMLIRMAE